MTQDDASGKLTVVRASQKAKRAVLLTGRASPASEGSRQCIQNTNGFFSSLLRPCGHDVHEFCDAALLSYIPDKAK